jgi:predicted phage-related endonuclease
MMTPEQHSLRMTGIGGTDVAAIFGESKRRPIDVCREKWGEAEPFDGNERTRWGELLEPVVAAEYAREAGVVLLRPAPPTLRHPDRPWHLGSPDRLCYRPERAGGDVGDWSAYADEPGGPRAAVAAALRAEPPDHGLEIKTHGYHAARGYYGERAPWRDGDDEDDPIPGWVRLQCAWYMALMDVDRWDVAALIDTHQHRIFAVGRDLELEGYLLEEAERFWTQHVIARVPPPPDGSASFADYLRRRFTLHDAEIVDGSADAERWTAELLDLKQQAKALAKREDLAKQHLQAIIGGHLGVRTSAGVVTWKERRSGRFRDAELREVLFDRAGIVGAERAALEAEYAIPNYRALNLPRAK